MSASSQTERLGAYVLPGGPADPTPCIAQARIAEELGLGTVFIGERYATKDLPSLAGALSQTTRRVRIAAGVTHVGTRHPMVLASMGQTLQALTGGRFVLGLGRGASARWRAYGITSPTNVMLTDTARILRRLWAGERVSYAGPLGDFPDLMLIERPPFPPPRLLLAGVGPRTLEVAGAAFDGAILHPLLTPAAVSRATQSVREGAASAGRDPDRVEIHATVIVAREDRFAEIAGARGLGYLLMQGLGDALVRANGWDPEDLRRTREHPRFAGVDYSALKSIPKRELAEISAELPPQWLADAAVTGSPAACSARLGDYLSSGASHLLLHGTTIEELPGVIDAFDADRF